MSATDADHAPLARATAAKRTLRPAILRWFDVNKRALPWRASRSPYEIWVSEVMLQQTQVERVIGYWRRFIDRFPSVESLASAALPEVLALWSGLGYYSRARNLHRAAQVCFAEYGGALPSKLEQLRALPGFGPYTAGAVASIAFEQAAPIVDGNVARVFARLFLIEGAPGNREREKELWAIASALVSGERPGDFNQALMELGATTCTPTNPACLLCPARAQCGALSVGRVDELPVPKRATPRKALRLAVAVAQRGDTVLLARRPDAGLFGGLWELPSIDLGGTQNGATALAHLLGSTATIGPELEILERTLTHRDLSLHLHPVELPKRLGPPPSPYVEWRWVERGAIGSLGISSAMEKALPPLKAKRAPRAKKTQT